MKLIDLEHVYTTKEGVTMFTVVSQGEGGRIVRWTVSSEKSEKELRKFIETPPEERKPDDTIVIPFYIDKDGDLCIVFESRKTPQTNCILTSFPTINNHELERNGGTISQSLRQVGINDSQGIVGSNVGMFYYSVGLTDKSGAIVYTSVTSVDKSNPNLEVVKVRDLSKYCSARNMTTMTANFLIPFLQKIQQEEVEPSEIEYEDLRGKKPFVAVSAQKMTDQAYVNIYKVKFVDENGKEFEVELVSRTKLSLEKFVEFLNNGTEERVVDTATTIPVYKNENGEEFFVMGHEYRYTILDEVLQFASGLVENGKNARETSQSEAVEEHGARVDVEGEGILSWKVPGFSDENARTFTSQVISIGKQELQDNEKIRRGKIKVSEISQRTKGQVCDGTAAAFLEGFDKVKELAHFITKQCPISNSNNSENT